MERSFRKEVEALRLGAGQTFRGEGILAVPKALLQSGVSYVGGYQGAPVSHLIDVMVDAEDMMADLGVHLETCTNEASAAAMLGASKVPAEQPSLPRRAGAIAGWLGLIVQAALPFRANLPSRSPNAPG